LRLTSVSHAYPIYSITDWLPKVIQPVVAMPFPLAHRLSAVLILFNLNETKEQSLTNVKFNVPILLPAQKP